MKVFSSKFLFPATFFLAQALSSVPSSWLQSKTLLTTRGGGNNDESSFEILEETVAYSGWRTITQRKVRMRNGKIVDFDLVGVKTGPGAVLVFAWDTKTKTGTLIREYMPAPHKILWGLAAGLIEEKHGDDPSVAAQHELEEECHLTGGTWIPLSKVPSAMDKYSLTAVTPYLVLDPEPAIISNGEMNLVGGWGCMLAIAKLRELDLL
jgi:hypothetical protein